MSPQATFKHCSETGNTVPKILKLRYNQKVAPLMSTIWAQRLQGTSWESKRMATIGVEYWGESSIWGNFGYFGHFQREPVVDIILWIPPTLSLFSTSLLLCVICGFCKFLVMDLWPYDCVFAPRFLFVNTQCMHNSILSKSHESPKYEFFSLQYEYCKQYGTHIHHGSLLGSIQAMCIVQG